MVKCKFEPILEFWPKKIKKSNIEFVDKTIIARKTTLLHACLKKQPGKFSLEFEKYPNL